MNSGNLSFLRTQLQTFCDEMQSSIFSPYYLIQLKVNQPGIQNASLKWISQTQHGIYKG